MRKAFCYVSVLVVMVTLFNSCERDDICAEATVTTPRLIIEFFDEADRGSTRNVNSLLISEIESDTAIPFSGTSTIQVPLKTNAIETTYIFNINSEADNGGLVDTITFSHTIQEQYVNRACGFKSNFLDFRAAVATNPDGWIQDIQILENIIEDESETHLSIFY